MIDISAFISIDILLASGQVNLWLCDAHSNSRLAVAAVAGSVTNELFSFVDIPH